MDDFLEKFQTAFGDTLSIAMIDICASNISSISRKICNIWNLSKNSSVLASLTGGVLIQMTMIKIVLDVTVLEGGLLPRGKWN